jgi:hypothetical protein
MVDLQENGIPSILLYVLQDSRCATADTRARVETSLQARRY